MQHSRHSATKIYRYFKIKNKQKIKNITLNFCIYVTVTLLVSSAVLLYASQAMPNLSDKSISTFYSGSLSLALYGLSFGIIALSIVKKTGIKMSFDNIKKIRRSR
jgi:heme/copper-type cytochrome/quinol oxidase subunit 3